MHHCAPGKDGFSRETETNKSCVETEKKTVNARTGSRGRVEQEEVSAEHSSLNGCSESRHGSRLQVWQGWKRPW